ncbi:MAG: hypothetical protein KGI54_04290 [Pseudomonadota bacterium]|nr:hypothetical protein [Pseudomonadota bacterium]
MFEYQGKVYAPMEDMIDYSDFTHRTKTFDPDWVERSGFVDVALSKGYRVEPVDSERLSFMSMQGWSAFAEFDSAEQVVSTIVHPDPGKLWVYRHEIPRLVIQKYHMGDPDELKYALQKRRLLDTGIRPRT